MSPVPAPPTTTVTGDGRMPLTEHLRELRNRLAKALLFVTLGILISFFFWQPILDVLREPFCRSQGDASCGLYAFGPLEQFSIRLKVSSIAGVVLSSPLWLYQLGAFITPALHRKEKRYAAAFLGASLVLFLTGTVVAYVTLDKGLDFLLSVGGEGVVTLTSLKQYLDFVSLTLLAFGVAFLFPVVLVFLNIVGVLTTERMRAWRRGMSVGIAAGAAVLTPSTDPYTFAAMAVPLYGLYELCILLGRLRDRARRRSSPEDPDDPDTPSALDPRPSPL